MSSNAVDEEEARDDEQEVMSKKAPDMRRCSAHLGSGGDSRAKLAKVRKTKAQASKTAAPFGKLIEFQVQAELPLGLGPGICSSNHEELKLQDNSSAIPHCHYCDLPLCDDTYALGDDLMHGKCMAQFMLFSIRKAQQQQEHDNDEVRRKRREEFGIGWKVERIPCNASFAGTILCPVAAGFCCLVLDQATNTVSLASTFEPRAAVNLEYLFTVLHVRSRGNREPFFSLDPSDDPSGGNRDSMLMKHFEPAWLAGTSVGEVLFQADYHLKELSMGDVEQAVIGMKSVPDIANFNTHWNARVWYVVRKAEVQISEENMLLPSVRMGVRASEQTLGEDGLKDVPITDPSNPLMKYAKSFSHYFELIAERKSVIYHLRELAKASVLAKFLVESNVNFPDNWLAMGCKAEEAYRLEVPQLWKERNRTEIYMCDSGLMDLSKSASQFLTLYGGVHFGLDNFQLSRLRRPCRAVKAGAAASQLGRSDRHPSGRSQRGAAGVSSSRLRSPAGSLRFPSVQPGCIPAGGSLERFLRNTARRPTSTASASLAAWEFERSSRQMRLVLPSRQSQRSFACPRVDPTQLSTSLSAGTLTFPPIAPPHPRRPRISSSLSVGRIAMASMRQPRVSSQSDDIQPLKPRRLILSSITSLGISDESTSTPPWFDRAFGCAKGVDLNLDKFNLSAPMVLPRQDPSIQRSTETSISNAFWLYPGGEVPSMYSETERTLLQKVFNPVLSDRRGEGDRFIPPETSSAYIKKLRSLVEEEELMQRNRRAHFFSKAFDTNEPGPLFPSSWMTSVNIFHGDAATKHGGLLHALLGCELQAHEFEQVLESIAPIFNKTTEDGIRFRIYRFGGLELRTTQEPGGTEVVGAVFLSPLRRAPSSGAMRRSRGSRCEEERTNKACAIEDPNPLAKVLHFATQKPFVAV